MDRQHAERKKLVEDLARQGIALQIRATRLSRGMTQDDLAKAAGMKQEQISRLEKADKNTTLATLVRVAKALDVALIVRFERFKAFGIPSFEEENALARSEDENRIPER